MSDDERKPRLHIHIGGLIIIAIILLILFKVDIKSKIKSPQFQKNITYVETEIKTLWKKYISDPLKSKAGEVVTETLNNGVKEIQNSFTENILKTNVTTQDTE